MALLYASKFVLKSVSYINSSTNSAPQVAESRKYSNRLFWIFQGSLISNIVYCTPLYS